jgi:lysyl-tRNA synthetase class 2
MPSTAIKFFRYRPATRQLLVTFITGREYVYDNVPPDVHDAFRATGSKGRFFNLEIRDRYNFREITSGVIGSARPGMAPDRRTASRR